MLARDLDMGDEFARDGIVVTVLRGPEPTKDLFGRDMIRVWCRREDTGAEGWVMFGRDAVIDDAGPDDPCAGRGGTKDDRCGRTLGHSGPCDWCD